MTQDPFQKQFEWGDDAAWIQLTQLNGKIYGAFLPKGHTEPHFVYSEDGQAFKTAGTAGVDGFGGCSIAAYHGRLWIAWAGGDANQSLCLAPVVLDQNGVPKTVDLSKKIQSVQSSGAFPWLEATDKGLYITWLGRGNGHPCIARVNVP